MLLNSIDYKVLNGDKDNFEDVTIYKLGEHYTVYKNSYKLQSGKVLVKFSVKVSYEDRMNHYIPEIYYDDDFSFLKAKEGVKAKPKFTIQTTAYGSMNVEEINKVIAGYQEAVEAAKILNMNFC